MIALEVWMNGEKKCVAGDDKASVLSAILHGPPHLSLRVGGLIGEAHTEWLEAELHAGDEITIRLIETETVDEPIERHFSQTRAEREAKVRAHLESARVLLPESAWDGLKIYRERLAENYLMGAMDALENLGDASGAGANFWRELGHAAHQQTAYEDRNRYHQKWEAIKAAASDAPSDAPEE